VRKTKWWIVLSIVITVASASERPITAQYRVCGGKTPPHGIEAHEDFREAFLQVALMYFPEFQFQPFSPGGGPRAAGQPPAGERMVWRRDKSSVTISYVRMASIEDAATRLCWHREMISVGTRLVEGFADEAYEPPYNARGNGHLYYRRGRFFFTVSVNLEPDVNNRADTSVPGSILNPAIDIARLLLAAADEVLAAEPK
jgi:hypothetical protein